MDNNRKKLERWLRAQCFGEHDEPLSRIVIKHSAQGSKGSQVAEHKIDKVGSDDLPELMETLLQSVMDDASGMGGQQRYILEAFHGNTFTARHAMRVEGYDDSLDGDSQELEPATNKGLVAQSQRHAEVLMKSFANSLGATFQTTQRIIAKQQDTIESLLDKRMKDFLMVEEAMTRKHEREVEMLQLVSGEERKDKMIEQGMDSLKTLGPAVINRIAGKDVLPAPNPQMLLLKGFVETISNDQLMKMAHALEPHQQIAFFELLKTFQPTEKAADEKKSNGHS